MLASSHYSHNGFNGHALTSVCKFMNFRLPNTQILKSYENHNKSLLQSM